MLVPMEKYTSQSLLGRFGVILFKLSIFTLVLYLAYLLATVLVPLFIAIYYMVGFVFVIITFVFSLGMLYLSGALSFEKIFALDSDGILETLMSLSVYVQYAVIASLVLSVLAIIFLSLDLQKNKKTYRIVLASIFTAINVIALVLIVLLKVA